MNTSHIVSLAVIVLILVLAFHKYSKKEGFRMASPAFHDVIESSEVPISQEHSPNIIALNGSNFKGGDSFGDLVASPSLPVQKQDEVGRYYTPQEMMPTSTMEQGARHNADGSIPNEGNVIAVNLAKSKHSDCMLVFNVGIDEGNDGPVNSIHSYTDDHFKNYSLISGTEYDRSTGKYDKGNRRLELAYV